MNKKAGVVEIVSHPVFVIVIFALVLVAVLNSAQNIGKSVTFDKKADAASIGLLIDAVQSVPRELSVFVHYPLKFGVDIKDNLVTVFEDSPRDGMSFFYNVNPDFKVFENSFTKKDLENSNLVISRSGNKVDFSLSKDFKFKEEIFCPSPNKQLKKVEVFSSSTADILEKFSPLISKTGFPSEDVNLIMDFMSVPKGVRIFVPDQDSLIGCHLMSAILQELPDVSVAVVPSNPVVLHPLDKRYQVLSKYKNSIIIGFSDDVAEQDIAHAVFTGLRSYGL